jgi:PiT family inorganic phosphate transporter
LIGSIIGVGLGYMLMAPGKSVGQGVNWGQAREVGLSLLLSPIIGFCGAASLLLLARLAIKRPELFTPPKPNTAPPLWVRSILFLTCTGVSFAHGSNDGQKGMGLIMLILIGILPATYSLNLNADARDVGRLSAVSRKAQAILDRQGSRDGAMDTAAARAALSDFLRTRQQSESAVAGLTGLTRRLNLVLDRTGTLAAIPSGERRELRGDLYLVSESLGKLDFSHGGMSAADLDALRDYRVELLRITRFIPPWVKMAVACALGIGTMIGWKRIVVTVGEKIGKDHLTYAQGAAAELVAMTTIAASDYLGMPVSTTHVLSSGVAGTMAANHSGLQMNTLRNLLLAWVLTLPVCALLGAGTFSLGLYIVLHWSGVN